MRFVNALFGGVSRQPEASVAAPRRRKFLRFLFN